MGISDIHSAMADAPNPTADAAPDAATPAPKPAESDEQTETPPAAAKDGDKATEADPKQPEKPAEPMAKQHAALTRRIRAAEDVERRAETRQKEVEARELKAQQFEQKLAAMKEDELLQWEAERRGLTLDQLVKRAIKRIANGGNASVEDEVADLKRERQREKERENAAAKQAEEDAARNSQAAVDSFISGTLDMITEDAHPLISDLESTELSRRIFAVANEYATKTGKAPDRREVLDYLEQLERERTEARVAKLSKKTATETPQDAGAVPGNGKPEPQTRTLTNNAAAETSGAARKPPENWRDRIAFAAEAIPD